MYNIFDNKAVRLTIFLTHAINCVCKKRPRDNLRLILIARIHTFDRSFSHCNWLNELAIGQDNI